MQPPITDHELREWLLDADLPLDDATIARVLPKLQPMRATLRAAGLKRLAAMLRGEAMTAGWVDARASLPLRQPLQREYLAAVESSPRVQRGSVAKRAVIMYLALVLGTFGLMSLVSSSIVAPTFFFALAAFFAFVSVTGWGLAGRDVADRSATVRLGAVVFLCLLGGYFVLWGVSGFLRTVRMRGGMGRDYVVEACLVGFGALIIAVAVTRARRR